MRKGFTHYSEKIALWAGSPVAFVCAASLVIVWALTGPLFDFSDTWQLVINTGTTVITFLMVFLIQNTQNRDTRAMHLKLDELIRATQGAHTSLLDLEEMEEKELSALRDKYLALAQQAHDQLKAGREDIDTPSLT